MKHESVREAVQAAPPITVGGFTFLGIPMNELVLWATLIYTLLLIIGKSPSAYAALIFWYKKARGKHGQERSD